MTFLLYFESYVLYHDLIISPASSNESKIQSLKSQLYVVVV